MTISPFDSTLYGDLFGDTEVMACFSDAAQIRAMIGVERALARVQGELRVIPEESANAIDSVLASVSIDSASLASSTAQAGVPVPALVASLREHLEANHAQYLHWGVTSQDIVDTGQALRLSEVTQIVEQRVVNLLNVLGGLAERYANQPLAARTRMQSAVPTSFGATVASWGYPLLAALRQLRTDPAPWLWLSCYGAAGNSSALGDSADAQRQALGRELDLPVANHAWHSDRSGLADLSGILTRTSGALAKLGDDIALHAQTGIGELSLGNAGGSSTMPNKNNPVVAETLITLFQVATAANNAMHSSLVHRQQRDGAAWSLEWHALPQVCMACARGLTLATTLCEDLSVNVEAMQRGVVIDGGALLAEAASFKLAQSMSRVAAQEIVKKLCSEATNGSQSLYDLLSKAYPDIDWESVFDVYSQLGDAPQQAQHFAAAVAGI
ncbi:MAG: lyase family protein [Pseudomonadota bacterium]